MEVVAASSGPRRSSRCSLWSASAKIDALRRRRLKHKAAMAQWAVADSYPRVRQQSYIACGLL